MADPIPVDENGNPITAAPAASSRAPIPVDENGQPLTDQPPSIMARIGSALDASTPYSDLGTRAGIRVLTAPYDLLANIVQGFGAPTAANIGMAEASQGTPSVVNEPAATQPHPVWSPSEAVINALGVQMDPNASEGIKTADAILPWLIPTGNQLSRVNEAAGPFNKVMTGARSEAGNLADWFLSDEGQRYARDHGWGPVAETIAGIAGGSARHVVARTGGATLPTVAGTDTGGDVYDVNRNIGVTPPSGAVLDPNKSAGKISSGLSAFPFSGTGEAPAVKAQTDAIANIADKGLQQLSPDVTPVKQAGPDTLNDFSTDLGNQGRAQIEQNEAALKARSDALESQIGLDRRVDATPVLNAAVDVATDPNAGANVRSAALDAYNRINSNVSPTDGTIAFNALKTERSTFGGIVDNMFQSSTGARGGKDTVAKAISPIDDAMSGAMQDAANQAGPSIGPQWGQLEDDWSAHSAMKRSLADTAGVLGDVNRPGQKWDTYVPADKVQSQLNSAVKGGNMPKIDDISQGLGPDLARQAVAETIAAKGHPAGARSNEQFRPDIWGQQAGRDVNQNVMDWIGDQAGPDAQANLEASIAAGKTTGAPSERGGLKRTLGSTAAGGAALYGAGALGGPLGLAALPAWPLIASALNDPSFIRSVAGRGVTADNVAGLMSQYATHAGLGANPDRLDPAAVVRTGAGQVLNAATQVAKQAPGVVSSLMKYIP